MVITVIISTALFAVVSNRYVNRYFDEYIENIYSNNLNNIIEFAKLVLTVSRQQKIILNSYITEPIYHAEIYDKDGILIMESNVMGNKFHTDENTMNVEYHNIVTDEGVIGQVLIVRAKEISYTNTKQVFVKAIFAGALIAVILVAVIMGIIGAFIIRYLSRDTKKVVKYATDEAAASTSSEINEFSQIINAITRFREKLAIKDRVKKEKFDTILHETKTPITVLKSQLEGAVDGIINIDKDRASSMTKEVDKLDKILKDATTIIEGNEIRKSAEIKKIDYSERIQKIVSSLKMRFNKKGLDLLYDKKPFVVDTDTKILDNVLYNLLINGYKYTQEGSVAIITEKNQLIIRDTGQGIASEDIPNVFKPYFRGDNISHINGEGLGLYNVKKDLDLLGVTIELTSKINEFTEFRLTFK